MKNPQAKPALIWALDPLDTEFHPMGENLDALSRWARDAGWEIQPVTVATPSAKELERGVQGAVSRFQQQLDAVLAKLGFSGARPGRVLVNEETTRDGAVKRLLRYAEAEGAAAIAVSSHGRSGLDRMVLGSFAESVLALSPLPIFFLSHLPAPAKAVNRVLLPTNFSDESWKVYRSFLETFRDASAGGSAELVLFHAVPYPIPPAGLGIYLPEGYGEDQEKWAKDEGLRWVEEARRCGLKAEAIVRVSGAGFVTGEAVLEAAAELGVSAIVMSAKSNAASRVLMGSVAYPVLRANRYLTIVYGPNAARGA